MASGVNRNSDARTHSIGDATFESSTLESLFEEIRSIGFEGRHHMPTRENERQYIICGVFSHDEIETIGDYKRHIEEFENHLKSLNERGDLKLGARFICNGRFAVLLNHLGRHGEARLFDPDGSLLRALDIRSDVTERRMYLDDIKERFVRSLGAVVEPYIVLLSQLIPCTEPDHECARLIREYVEEPTDKIIVSYNNDWPGTDRNLALELLTHANICVVKPKTRQAHVNKEAMELEESYRSSSGLNRGLSSDEEQEHLDYVDNLAIEYEQRAER